MKFCILPRLALNQKNAFYYAKIVYLYHINKSNTSVNQYDYYGNLHEISITIQELLSHKFRLCFLCSMNAIV